MNINAAFGSGSLSLAITFPRRTRRVFVPVRTPENCLSTALLAPGVRGACCTRLVDGRCPNRAAHV